MECDVNWCKRGTEALGASNHARQTNRQIGNVSEQVSNRTVTKVILAVKMTAQRNDTRTIPSCSLRWCGCRDTNGTDRTTNGMLLIIGNSWSE